MKTWKAKALALLLCLTVLVCLTSCGGDTAANTDAEDTADADADAEDTAADAAPETRALQLGTSVFSVMIPVHFTEEELTDEDKAENTVGYYRSGETLMDFDVYQFSKEGHPDTLAEFVTEQAAEYNVAEIFTDAEVNGIALAYFRSVEEFEGVEYNIITYAFEDNGEYVEIVFWLDGETAENEANAIISTLIK